MLNRIAAWLYGKLYRAAHRIDLQRFQACGKNVHFNPGVVGDPGHITVGNHVYVGPESYIWAKGGLTIGSNVIIGPRVTIHTVNHRYLDANLLPYDAGSYALPVTIESNVWIGGHVMIAPGVRIGEGAVVAMGAVVTRDVPPGAVVGGNPARVIKHRDPEHYRRLVEQQAFYLEAKLRGVLKPELLERPDKFDAPSGKIQ